MGAVVRALLDLPARARGGESRLLLAEPGPGRRLLLRPLQAALLALRLCRVDHIGDRAATLAFATLLSLLPLTLLALAVLGAIGVPPGLLADARAWLYTHFLPATARALSATLEEGLASIAASTRSLGLTGLVLLVAAGSGLLGSLGRVFARIWGPARFAGRIPRVVGFWTAVILGPFLIGASIYLVSVAPESPLISGVLRPASALLAAFAAAFLAYLFLPGRRVALAPAATGALVATAVWELARWLVGLYVHWVLAASPPGGMLAGIGIVPLALFWLYLCWVAFLAGAEVAFVLQAYPDALRRAGVQPV